MVIFLFLFSPILVELVDLNGCIALLKQVKSLRVPREHRTVCLVLIHTATTKNLVHSHRYYLIDFTEAAPAEQVQQQVPLIQGRMVFKSVEELQGFYYDGCMRL